MNFQHPKPKPSVLVVGAGLAGMTAAHHLAEWGAQIALADRAPHLGGAFLALDHTFTTDFCGFCIALPRQPSYCPTITSELHPLITPLPRTTLAALEGESGDFVARLGRAPRYVDPYPCDNCGACATVCPAPRLCSGQVRQLYSGQVPQPCSRQNARSRSIWGRALHEHPQQKAIYPPPPRAVPFAYAIDPDVCTRCGACAEVCPRGAIDLEAAPTETQIEIDAVVLSPGFAAFDAALAVEYGWGRCANVVTSLEFERMLNRSGPTRGRPLRPSDGQVPARIAFIHCVGSRSERLGRPYCSTSCCMITAKQVGLTRKVAPQTKVTVFTMDVRTVGKGYERYYQRAAALPGVTYHWGRPAAVHEIPRSSSGHTLREQSLRLLTPDGEEIFDLVVLAVGMGPSDGVRELAACAGVALDSDGFVLPGDDGPGSTSRQGVYAAGSALAPADVPEAVTQAAAAAALAAQVLSPAPHTFSCPQGRPQPSQGQQAEESRKGPSRAGLRDLTDQLPRIGLFLCTCRSTLEGPLDYPALTAGGKRLRAVAHVEQLQAACERSGLSAIERAVMEHDLNRIVVAGCSPRLYGDRFNAMMDRLCLPPRLLARANIREGAAWAQAGSPAATAVARDELAMAVAGLRETPYRPLNVCLQENIARRVLVLGGGIAGMTAALTLAALGIDNDLVERQAQLGGNLRGILHTLGGLDAQALLTRTVDRVPRAEKVRVWTEAKLADWSGVRGDFSAEIRLGDEPSSQAFGLSSAERSAEATRRERYGALIVATGAEPATTSEYLYGQHEQVTTQRELEEMLAYWETGRSVSSDHSTSLPTAKPPRRVVMIQCVGSRNDEHPYCSRVCCAQAIKNALALKELVPGVEVSILFRDMRTMGTHELYYQQARRLGVRTLRYEPPEVPLVKAEGDRLSVTIHDTLYDERVTLEADLLALSTGIVPPEVGNGRLANMLGVSLDEDGFYAEAHPKLRPTDLAQPGVYLCGMAYGPRTIAESIAQARAAALRAALTVARPPQPRRDIASVEKKLCSFCGLCVTHCPYGARVLDKEERIARVIDPLCQGCGVCVAVCPNGASRQPALEPVQVLALVDAALIE